MSLAQPWVSSVRQSHHPQSGFVDHKGHTPTTPKRFCPDSTERSRAAVAAVQRSSVGSSRSGTPSTRAPTSRPASQASSSPPEAAAQPRSKSWQRSRRRAPEPELVSGSARSSLRRPLSSASSRIYTELDANKDDAEAWRTNPNVGCKRNLLCNFRSGLGQRCLLAVDNNSDQTFSPYKVKVRYDLRPINHLLAPADFVFLAAFDVEKLRRKGTGRGLDVVECSNNWIARDCLCMKSGKMRLLRERKCPGELSIALRPAGQDGIQEAAIMLRVVAIRQLDDPQDWHTMGSPVLLRMDMVGKMLQQDVSGQQRPRGIIPSVGVPDSTDPVNCGLTVQQLIDFRDEVTEDLHMYCRTHNLCTLEGIFDSFHVCMSDPCPFKPMNLSTWDDHRDVPHISRSALHESDARSLEALRPISPNMHFIVQRYIRPMTQDTGRSYSSLINPNRPVKASVFVAHAWSEHFTEFVDTLTGALDREDTVFVASFSLNQNSSIDFLVDIDIDEWFDSLFQKIERVIVVVDERIDVVKRLWCNIEVLKAREHLKPTCLWPHKTVNLALLKDAIDCADVQSARCTKEYDESVLLDTLICEDHHIENYTLNLRTFLRQRTTIFAESLQLAAQFKDFCPERMKQIHAERERRVVLQEIDNRNKGELAALSKDAAHLAFLKTKVEADSAVQEFEFSRRLSQQRHIHEDEELSHEREHQHQQILANREIKQLISDGEQLRQHVALLEEALQKQMDDAEEARNSAAHFQVLITEERTNTKREATRAEQERKAAEQEREKRRNEEEQVLSMKRLISEANERAAEAADALARQEAEMEDTKKQLQVERQKLKDKIHAASRRNARASVSEVVKVTSPDNEEDQISATSSLSGMKAVRTAMQFSNIASLAMNKSERGISAVKDTTKDVAAKGAQAVASTAAKVTKIGQVGANLGAETGKKIARFGKALLGSKA